MIIAPARNISRREWLRLGPGAMLALGAWPGCARWAGNRRDSSFQFAVLNDTHFQSPRCPEWFERVRASIRTHRPRPEFTLMLGDLVEHGTESELGGMRDALRSFGMPFHPVIGNHDYLSDTDRSAWNKMFPRRLNYAFMHRGWQFIALDSTQGTRWKETRIQPATFQWLDNELPRLDRAAPTVAFTHFPLGDGVRYRPLNADDLLARLVDFNLVAVLSGHWHGFTERRRDPAVLTTNCCCAVSRGNHDGSSAKGYFLCTATADGLQRQSVEVKPG